MTTIDTARTRAEELFHNLQKKAKDLIEAEEGVAKTVRQLVEEKGLAPAEVQKKLEELVGSMKANKVWERVRQSETFAAISDYRGEVERRFEGSTHRLMELSPFASRTELADLHKQLGSLNKKVAELTRKLDSPN